MILCNCLILPRASPRVETNAARRSGARSSLAMTRCRWNSASKDLLAPRASPAIAVCTLRKRALVNPAIAETITTGCDLTASFTIPTTRRRARVSSTEVPPNFITVVRLTTDLCDKAAIVAQAVSLRANYRGLGCDHVAVAASSQKLVGSDRETKRRRRGLE